MKRNMNRRTFVRTTVSGAAAISFAPSFAATGMKNKFDPKGLPTRALGKTGVQVPLMGFGCGSRWMSVQDDDQALGLLEHALDNGLYYWDTAASYGNDNISSEERIGKILPGVREKVFLVTKVDKRGADEARASIERSLKRLKTDYIDLLHVHSIASVEDAESLGEKDQVLEVLHDFRDQGVVKHIGFTGHTSAEGMKRAAELYDFEAMMIAMNHQVKSGEQKFEELAVPYAAGKGMGVVAMKVIRPRESVQGLDPEMLVRYALSSDHFSIANIGIDGMEVLEKNLSTIRKFKPLDDNQMEDVRASLDPFFRHRNVAWMQPGYFDGHANYAMG